MTENEREVEDQINIEKLKEEIWIGTRKLRKMIQIITLVLSHLIKMLKQQSIDVNILRLTMTKFQKGQTRAAERCWIQIKQWTHWKLRVVIIFGLYPIITFSTLILIISILKRSKLLRGDVLLSKDCRIGILSIQEEKKVFHSNVMIEDSRLINHIARGKRLSYIKWLHQRIRTWNKSNNHLS